MLAFEFVFATAIAIALSTARILDIRHSRPLRSRLRFVSSLSQFAIAKLVDCCRCRRCCSRQLLGILKLLRRIQVRLLSLSLLLLQLKQAMAARLNQFGSTLSPPQHQTIAALAFVEIAIAIALQSTTAK